jgi:hypothetical protein
MAFLRGEPAHEIWHAFKRNCPDHVLREIAEKEFEDLIAEATQQTCQQTIDQINKDTTE